MLQLYLSRTCRFHRVSEHCVGARIRHHLVDHKNRNVEFLARMGVSIGWLLGINRIQWPGIHLCVLYESDEMLVQPLLSLTKLSSIRRNRHTFSIKLFIEVSPLITSAYLPEKSVRKSAVTESMINSRKGP